MDFKHISQKEREQLYEEVWADPLTTVAKRYGMSDNGLRKHCKRLWIPLPNLGYWARVKAGQKIKIPDLPEVQGELRRYVHSYVIKYKSGIDQLTDDELKNSGALGLLIEDTINFLHETCRKVDVKSQLRNPSEHITKHKEESNYRRKRDRALQRANFNTNLYNLTKSEYRENEAMLPINVSEANLNRAYRILDALIKAIYTLEGHTTVVFDEGHDRAVFAVMRIYFNFEIKDEKRRKRKNKSEKSPFLVLSMQAKYWFYGSIREELEFKDSDSLPLEYQVGNIILKMFQTANQIRVQEILNEREEKREAAEWERQRKLELIRKGELKEIETLTQTVSDWDKAQKIRAFANDMEMKISSVVDEQKKGKLRSWLAWARDKADWLDPLTAKDDDLLGKSEHLFYKILQTE